MFANISFIGLLLLSSSPAMANEYTGENILDYLPNGRHVGQNCSVEVETTSSNRVMVSVESGSDYSNFNTSLLAKKDIIESAEPNDYRASFTLIPDDGYSGKKSNRIQIQKLNQKTIVSVKIMRRSLGAWRNELSANCTLNF